jgi:Myo-inositol oxygenase
VAAKQLVNRALRRAGYEIRDVETNEAARRFRDEAVATAARHERQTVADVAALRAKYREPVLGDVHVWDLYPILAGCIDPSDPTLGATSQLTHVLQVVDAMRDDGVSDPDLLLCALIHDLGKALLATGEDPANVVGMNGPIGDSDAGAGFDNCVFHWNHDEFGYSRFRDLVPDHVAWLIRYHSVEIDQPEVIRLMDDRDREYAAKHHGRFRRYDFGSKSKWVVPTARIDDYRTLLADAFPQPIFF